MIYTISDLKSALDEIFLPIEDDIQGMRLTKNKSSESSTEFLAEHLHCTFPEDFVDITEEYDFGNFAIGNIEFGYKEDYFQRLIKINNAPEFNQWWQGSDRPSQIVLIAISDPYSILLDCRSGAIYAMLSDDEWLIWREVSVNFEAFVRCVGSIYLYNLHNYQNLNKSQLLAAITSLTKAKDASFWEFLMV